MYFDRISFFLNDRFAHSFFELLSSNIYRVASWLVSWKFAFFGKRFFEAVVAITLYNIYYYTSARYISPNPWCCLLNRSYVRLEAIFFRILLMWQKFITKEIFYNLHYSVRLNISTIENSTFLIAKRNPLVIISVLGIENRNFVTCDEHCFPANEYLISKAKRMMQY